MTEKPILFKGDMVRRILSGDKNQTRRIIKPQPARMIQAAPVGDDWLLTSQTDEEIKRAETGEFYRLKGKYKRGDILWVRETWSCMERIPSAGSEVCYKADLNGGTSQVWEPWKPSIFMPRWASRITLEITDVRVQRVQEISEEDAIAEGVELLKPGFFKAYNCKEGFCTTAKRSFESLWEEINGNWKENPWVFAITFRKLE